MIENKLDHGDKRTKLRFSKQDGQKEGEEKGVVPNDNLMKAESGLSPLALNIALGKSSDHHGTRDLEIQERKTLTQSKETKVICCLRLAVYCVVTGVALVVSLGAYFFLRAKEEAEFESAFAWQAALVQEKFYEQCAFNDILPEMEGGANTQSVIAVISYAGRNSTTTDNDIFSYLLEGKTATGLGMGDQHDAKYDDIKLSYYAPKFNATRDDCAYYDLDVYPTQDQQDQYLTSDPAVFAVLTAVAFIFTSLVFLVYDCMVQRRHQRVTQKAVANSALVSSLYPKQVRDRLLDTSTRDQHRTRRVSSLQNKIQARRGSNQFNKSETRSSSNQSNNKSETLYPDIEGDLEVSTDESNTSNSNNKTPTQTKSKKEISPIADLYPATSIMFADLAGFTKWSSSKAPKDVFMLLETLYQAFDKLAVLRDVFKVETIGDCYVAATGLPEPQPDHAIRMAKFARDCQSCMHQLTESLKDTLGKEVTELAFRVGIHSGPITGGVLRGQKARFQLFGDTINCASRMESNGIPHKIHVSQATADEFIKHGKGHWLTPRKDKIVAKGKGEMQTYFVTFEEVAENTMSSDESVSVVAKASVEAFHDAWMRLCCIGGSRYEVVNAGDPLPPPIVSSKPP